MTTIGDATAVADIATLKILSASTYPRLRDKMWYSVPYAGDGGGKVLYHYDANGTDEGNDTSIVAHSIAGRFYAFRDPLGSSGGGGGGGLFFGVPVTLVGVGTGNPPSPPPAISSSEMVYVYLRVDVGGSSSTVRFYVGTDPTGETSVGGWAYVSLY